MIQDVRNNHRISRKPMPEKVKAEFCEKSKEHSDYKTYEHEYMNREIKKVAIAKARAMEACTFLPQELKVEIQSDNMEELHQASKDMDLYTFFQEQMILLYPKEWTEKQRLNVVIDDEIALFKVSRVFDQILNYNLTV